MLESARRILRAVGLRLLLPGEAGRRGASTVLAASSFTLQECWGPLRQKNCRMPYTLLATPTDRPLHPYTTLIDRSAQAYEAILLGSPIGGILPSGA